LLPGGFATSLAAGPGVRPLPGLRRAVRLGRLVVAGLLVGRRRLGRARLAGVLRPLSLGLVGLPLVAVAAGLLVGGLAAGVARLGPVAGRLGAGLVWRFGAVGLLFAGLGGALFCAVTAALLLLARLRVRITGRLRLGLALLALALLAGVLLLLLLQLLLKL